MLNDFNKIKIYNFIKIILFTYITFFILSSFLYKVFMKSYGEFVVSNLAIRDYFYSLNNVNLKGTHDNASLKWIEKRKKYRNLLSNLEFKNLKNEIIKLKKIDIKKTAYDKEYGIINLLISISKEKNHFKRETVIYIPKSQNIFWNLSCDSGMISFIIPAITNIAMLDGLPIKESSCYGQFDNYGYGEYELLKGFPLIRKDFSKNELCFKAKSKGYLRVIEILFNKKEKKFNKNIYLCN